MNQLHSFLQIKGKMFRHRLQNRSLADFIKIFGLGSLAVFFLSGLHWGFYRLLNYLQGVELIGNLLILKLLAMIFFTFLIMLIFSNFLTAFTTLYFARDLNWLMAKPINLVNIFFYKFAESAVYASLMIVITFIPFLIAYGQVKNANAFFYLTSLTIIFPFLIIAAAIGALACLLLMFFFPSAKTRDIFLVLGVIIGCTCYILFRFLQPEKLVNPDRLNEVIEYITVLQTPVAKYLPSWWLCAGLSALAVKKFWPFAFYCLLLWVTTFAAIFILREAAKNFYQSGWLLAQETASFIFFKNRSFWRNWEEKLFSSQQTLMAKDLKTFFRDSRQWSQLLLLGAIVVVYIFNIYKLPLDTFYLKSLISFLNIGLAGFVLSAIGLRFVFPLVSLERECFYLLRLSPFPVKKIIRDKFLLAVFPLLVLAVILVFVSSLLLKVDNFVLGFSLIATMVMALGICSLGVGMGAIFPRFRIENIAQIESSFGGMIYIIFSLFYIGLNLTILAWPIRLYFINRFNFFNNNLESLGIIFLLFILFNSIATFLPLYIGKTALEKYEE